MDFLIDGLAAHRLARLIVTDRIADRPRAAVMRALKEGGYDTAIEGLRCEWCVAVWVAGAAAVARAVAPRAWRPVARALAVADVAGIVSSVT